MSLYCEMSSIDGDGFEVGDRFSEVLDASVRYERCGACNFPITILCTTERLLVSMNKGHVSRKETFTCLGCGVSSLKSR